MEQNGSKLLKVVSIIMMIGGIIGAVASLIYTIVIGAGTALLGTSEAQAAMAREGINGAYVAPVMGLLWVGTIFLIAGSVFEIIAGVKGKNNWNNPAQAQTLLIFGIICAVLSVVGNVFFATGGAGVQVFSIITGLALPVLYIIGAVQLKNMQG